MNILRIGLVGLLIVSIVGCGEKVRQSSAKAKATSQVLDGSGSMEGRTEVAFADDGRGAAPEPPAGVKPPAAAPENAKSTPLPRKILFRAYLLVTVEDFTNAEQGLFQLVKSIKEAYVEKSEISGSPGSPRSGAWTVRVPVDQFDSFLEESAKLGELQKRTLDSDDVTERFYDLQASIKNNEAEEASIRADLLDKSVEKKEDRALLRGELRQLREKINLQQAQLQRWGKQAELATAVITIRERKDYVPEEAPAFGTSITRTFNNSTELLVGFGKGLVLILVALTAWLPVLAVLGFGSWFLRRAMRRKTLTPSQTLTPPG